MIRPGDVIEIGDSRFELLDHTKSFGQSQDLQAVRRFARVGFDDLTGYYRQLQQNTVVQIIARPINDTGQQVYPEYDDQGFELGEDRPPNAPPTPRSPVWTGPAPYKILRQATLTSDEPYQLPEGTAIDLRASGVGNTFFYYPAVPAGTTGGTGSHPRVDNDLPIFIMFAPEGRIARVTFSWSTSPSTSVVTNEKFDRAVAENVFLLVGRRENSPPAAVANDPTLSTAGLTPQGAPNRDQAMQELKEPINWLNGDSRWLVLGAQSGRIVTVENAFVDPLTLIQENANGPTPFAQSSEPMRSAQIIAAREFAPEMSQLGGR
jgi:hypothetical protein